MNASSVDPTFRQRVAKHARRLRHEPDLLIGLVLSGFVLLVVLFPGLFAGHSPLAVNVDRALEAPSAARLFATEAVGRDVPARVVFGARITLS